MLLLLINKLKNLRLSYFFYTREQAQGKAHFANTMLN